MSRNSLLVECLVLGKKELIPLRREGSRVGKVIISHLGRQCSESTVVSRVGADLVWSGFFFREFPSLCRAAEAVTNAGLDCHGTPCFIFTLRWFSELGSAAVSSPGLKAAVLCSPDSGSPEFSQLSHPAKQTAEPCR